MVSLGPVWTGASAAALISSVVSATGWRVAHRGERAAEARRRPERADQQPGCGPVRPWIGGVAVFRSAMVVILRDGDHAGKAPVVERASIEI